MPQSVWQLNTARAWLEFILEHQMYRFVVCQGAGRELVAAIDAVLPRKTTEFSTIDSERKLTWLEAANIRSGASEFETVFAAELPTFDTYVVSKKGIYSTADLVERADMAFDDSARPHLSAEILSDFRQAGRCLAFELATGAGFHTMRAVEAVLRHYWRLVLKPPASARAPEMFNCISDLRNAGESEKLMNILDDIRDLHRNTIMHPEAFLDMKDALRLFDVAKSAISAMADRIGEIKEAEAEAAKAKALDAAVAAAVAAAREAAVLGLGDAAKKTAAIAPAASSILMLDEPDTAKAEKSNGDGTA